MIGWWIAVLLAVALITAGFYYYYRIWKPLQRLRELVTDLADGRRGSGWVADGDAGIAAMIRSLEKLDDYLAQICHQVEEEGFNLRGILSSMEEGVMVINRDKRIILANQAIERLFHLPTSPVSKTMMEALRNADVQRAVEAVLRSKESQKQEIVLTRFDGDARVQTILSMNASPLKDEKRPGCGVVIAFHDITPIKEMENVRREFVANVSHELRTPLSIFKGYVETLLDNPTWLNPDAHRIVEVLERHSDRLHAIVEDLLTLSRFESGAVQLNVKDLHAPEFLQQILSDWQMSFSKKPCKLTLGPVSEDLYFSADPLRIEQIFNNLLDNALKYSRPEDAVEIGCHPENGEVVFYVKDNGIGIPPEKLPHIFERFFRVDQARSREMGGTGLGLTIVKEIVRLHKGAVKAESELNHGTVISFTLPRAAGH